MSKNLKDLKTDGKDPQYYDGLGVGISIMYYLVPIFEDFEKRLTELEKYKNNILEHHEINETGRINNIKIVLNDPKLKKKGEKDGKH